MIVMHNMLLRVALTAGMEHMMICLDDEPERLRTLQSITGKNLSQMREELAKLLKMLNEVDQAAKARARELGFGNHNEPLPDEPSPYIRIDRMHG